MFLNLIALPMAVSLIVDDVATNREFIREALMCQEYKITEAVAGGQALEMMEVECVSPTSRPRWLN